MIHPNTEAIFVNDLIGKGLFATQFIPCGTITWALGKNDKVFSQAAINNMDKEYWNNYKRYMFSDSKGNYILCTDNAQFTNHSFVSNCLMTAYGFEIAVRDIEPGEELTSDYGTYNVLVPLTYLAMEENDELKRKVVMPNDLLFYHHYWDKKLLNAFKYFDKVAQPLKDVIKVSDYEKCLQIAGGKVEMDSVLNYFFDRK